MLKKLWEWFRSCRAIHRYSIARREAAQWTQESRELLDRLRRNTRRLKVQRKIIQEIVDVTIEDLDLAEDLARGQGHVVEALNEELKILGEMVVPELTAMHRLRLEQIRAETAQHVLKQVAYHQSSEPE